MLLDHKLGMNSCDNNKMPKEISARKDDYTVIVMLKDRSLFTKRWLNYMSFIKFPFKIYIADGSSDDSIKDYIQDNKTLKDLHIEYRKYPYDATYPIYYKKMADALGRVKTKYVSLSDNDDFYVTEGIIRSIAFLEKNPDYSSCRGDVSTIAVFDEENQCLYGKAGGIRYKCYHGISIENGKSSERIMKHMTKYDPTFYDVHRTEHLKACFEKLSSIASENLYLAEYLTSCMTVASGKIKRLPYAYYIRQANSPGSSNYAESAKYDFFERMLLESWSHDFCKTAEAVAEIISRTDGISLEEALVIFKNGYKRLVAANIIWSMNRKNVLSKQNILGKLTLKINCKVSCMRRSYFWRRMVDRFGFAKKNIDAFKQVVIFLEKGTINIK